MRQSFRACALIKITSGKHLAFAHCSKSHQESISRPRVACFYAGEQKCVRVLPAFTLGNENASAFCLLLRWGRKMGPRFAHFCVGERKRARALLIFALGKKNALARWSKSHRASIPRLRVSQNHVRRSISRLRVAHFCVEEAKCAELLLPCYSPLLPVAHCRILLRHTGALPCDTSAHTSATRSRIALRRSCAIAAPA